MELLQSPKPPGTRESFLYYKKEVPVPVVGDIIDVCFKNFSRYFIIVTNVTTGKGKEDVKYTGYTLAQKGISCGMAPSSIRSREDFELPQKLRRMVVNPKDRSVVDYMTITEF